MARTLSPSEKREAARRLREDWADMGNQIKRLQERRMEIWAEADRLMLEAVKEERPWTAPARESSQP